MKLLGCLLMLIVGSAASFGLQVVGTYPRTNSENFAAIDTLQITFDASPAGVELGDIFVQGTNAAYPLVTGIVRDNTLFLIPSHVWLTGDHIMVTVSFPAVNPAYSFHFRVNVSQGTTLNNWSGGELISPGHVPLAMTGVDMDGDGPVDVGILYTDQLGIARNILYDDPCGTNCFPYDGLITFLTPNPGISNGPRVLRSADLNRDGHPELVASSFGANTLVIYRNVSTPGQITFSDTTQIVLDMTSPRDFRLLDVNADGWIDILCLGQTPDPAHDRLAVYLNAGLPDFIFSLEEFETGSGPDMLEITDFTFNGKLDLVTSCVDQRALNRFQLSSFSPLSFLVDTLFSGLPSGPDGVLADNLYWDVGISQRPDLMIWSRGAHSLDESPYIARYRNIGAGFAAADSLEDLTYTPLHVTLADLDPATGNSASHEWVVVGDSAGDTHLWFYNALGEPINVHLESAPLHPLECQTFDADLDGDMDLFFVDVTSETYGRIVYDRNPDSSSVSTGALDFGVVQNRCSDDAVFWFHNYGQYPAVVCNVTMPDPAGGAFDAVSPTQFPITLEPLDSLPFVFRYTPCYNEADTGMARIAFYGGIGGCHQLSIYLMGISGHARMMVSPDSALNFGSTARGGTLIGTFQMVNAGNWSLTAHYDPSALHYFTYLGPDDEIVPPGGSSPPHTVIFTAPANSPDTFIVELMPVIDTSACDDCPVQPAHDTRWIYFYARIVTNLRPVFTFPNVIVREGDVGVFTITVHDSNARAPDFAVISRFDSMMPPGGALSLFPDSLTTAWQWRDTIQIPYQIADSVHWPAEHFQLNFAAIDTPFLEQMDTVWALTVHARDDLPRFLNQYNITVWEGTNITNAVLATVADEENEPIGGIWHWLDRVPQGAQVRPPGPWNTFSLNWQTTYTDSGSYPLQLKIYESGDTTRSAETVVTVTIVDRPSNLQASVQVTPDTTALGTSVSVHWEVRETSNVPEDRPFAVQLVQTGPHGGASILMSQTYPSLPAGGMIGQTQTVGPLDTCGTYLYTFTVSPELPDSTTSDNVANAGAHVLCPDIAAYIDPLPPSVPRGAEIAINYRIRELHGVAVHESFSSVLVDESTGDTVAVRVYANGIGALGTITGTTHYVTRECGTHSLVLTVYPPPGYEDDPTDNSGQGLAEMICPDLAALAIDVPAQIHKNVSFPIRFTIGELNGIAVDTAFIVSLYVGGQRQDFRFLNLAAFDSVSSSLTWDANTMGSLEILLRVNPPSGWDQNPLNDTLTVSMDILADPFNAYPLPFTPNGDSYNDTLHFYFGDEIYSDPVIKIFTVDGKLVKTLEHAAQRSIDWDGRDRDGNDCAPGPYLYTFDDGGRKISSGIIYVAR